MMSRWIRLLTAGLLMLPLAARAQVLPVPDSITPLVADYIWVKGLDSYEVATWPAKDIIAAAFDTEYGRALVAELRDILMDSADKSCLQSRKLSRANLARGAGEIYQRYGTQMIEGFRSIINVPAYEAALKARAPTLHADVARLRGDPDVQKLLALEQPTRFSGIANLVVGNLVSYLMVRRIAMNSSGLMRGYIGTTDRYVTKQAEEQRHQFVANSTSPQLKQYIALLKTLRELRSTDADAAAALRLGPDRFFSGIEADLARLCISGIKRP